ncbi:MAG: GrpB family protein [Clostridia bacterium]|nr:GrpB family protein [Clostridia bacterium]
MTLTIGLERGAVRLCDHQTEWEAEAARTIARLRSILGDVIKGIEHVGSTSVYSIKAKPIIDIAVAVDGFDAILPYEARLRADGFYYRPDNNTPTQLLFACGSYYDGSGTLQTHFIHVVIYGSREWKDYLNFRDYLNFHPDAAREYEALKLKLSKNRTRAEYTPGKADFITEILRLARAEKAKEIL